ncbi:MAG: hypothetical protein AAGI23_14710 [Bacteroidota bacterium]
MKALLHITLLTLLTILLAAQSIYQDALRLSTILEQEVTANNQFTEAEHPFRLLMKKRDRVNCIFTTYAPTSAAARHLVCRRVE